MGRWSMRISASDEYEDVKNEFFTQFYYTAKPIEEIEKDILNSYAESYSSFDSDDGVWHDVYFALADCEWACGQLSEHILSKVENIIKSGKNISYLQSLAASDKDLKQRNTILKKFLIKLNTPKEKPITRKQKKPFVNPFKTGDVFIYKYKEYYYGGIVLQVWDDDVNCEEIYKSDTLHYCIAIAELKSASLLTVEQIKNAKIRCVEWIIPFNLPKTGKFEILDNIKNKISKDYRNYFCAYNTRYGIGLSGWFDDDFLEMISDEENYEEYLRKYDIFDRELNYLFDTKKLVKTKSLE